MKCHICGKEFTPYKITTKSCSKECYKIAKNQYQKEYRTTDKGKKTAKRYYIKNKDKIIKKAKEYQRLEKCKEYKKQWLKTELGKNKTKQYYKKRVESGSKKKDAKKYYQTLNGKVNNKKAGHKRRALKKNCLHEDYSSQLKEVKSLKTFTCYWCGKKYDVKDLHLDHVIPLSKGGADIWSNIALSCAHCNLTKHNKLPEEFNKTLEQPRLII